MPPTDTLPDRAAPPADPYLAPSMSLANRAGRAAWGIVSLLLVRPSPRPFHAWRRWVLRAFGAQLGPNCRIYAKAQIWAPWNLICADAVIIANGAIVYNPLPIRIGSHGVVSQQAFLCGATHDMDDPAFPMVSSPITLGPYAWVCARATVCPGVTLGEGAVLGLGSVATRDIPPWAVHAGVPARFVRQRNRTR